MDGRGIPRLTLTLTSARAGVEPMIITAVITEIAEITCLIILVSPCVEFKVHETSASIGHRNLPVNETDHSIHGSTSAHEPLISELEFIEMDSIQRVLLR